MRFGAGKSDSALREFRNSASLVPIGNEDVRVGIDVATVGRAEHGRADFVRIEFVPRPLRFLRIVSQKGDRRVVAIDYCDASFSF